MEALIGAEKRRRTAGEDAVSPGYEDGTDVSDLTGSPGLRADRACASDRGSEAECASVGSRKYMATSNILIIIIIIFMMIIIIII